MITKDLINRLRDTASKGVSVWGDLQIEAAKEIETLLAERECYASAMDRMQAALAEPSEPVYWQWRRKDKPWANEYIFAMELQATTDDSEVRKLFTHPASKPEPLTLGTIQRLWSAAGHKETLKGRVNAFARAVEAAVWAKFAAVKQDAAIKEKFE